MAMAPSLLPDWALLDRHIYRWDDESFPTGESNMATSATTRGDRIRVCFRFEEPPRPSRVFLWWPDKGLHDQFFFVAAHRDAVLFQVNYRIQDSPVDNVCEFFVYRVGSSSNSGPTLDLIPPIEPKSCNVCERVRRREGLSIGVLRRGQDFAVGDLEVPDDTAMLHMFKSSGGGMWKTTQPKIVSHSDADMEHVQCYWQTDHSFAFGSYLCWVDYCVGGIFLCKVFDEDPILEYLALPATLLDVHRDAHGGMPRLYHSIGVDEHHDLLKFVMISSGDGNFVKHILSEHDCSNMKVASWTLKITDKEWEVEETIKPSDLMRDQGLGELPCTGLWLPVVSMADMGTVFFMCSVYNKVGCPRESFLVAISMTWNTVFLAVPYAKPQVDDPLAEIIFENLVSIELPKHLKLETTRFQRQGRAGAQNMGSGQQA